MSNNSNRKEGLRASSSLFYNINLRLEPRASSLGPAIMGDGVPGCTLWTVYMQGVPRVLYWAIYTGRYTTMVYLAIYTGRYTHRGTGLHEGYPPWYPGYLRDTHHGVPGYTLCGIPTMVYLAIHPVVYPRCQTCYTLWYTLGVRHATPVVYPGY